MILGFVLLGISLIVLLLGLACWLRGIRLGFPLKFTGGLAVFCLDVAAVILMLRQSMQPANPVEEAKDDPRPAEEEPIGKQARDQLAAVHGRAGANWHNRLQAEALHRQLAQAHLNSVRSFAGKPGFGNQRPVPRAPEIQPRPSQFMPSSPNVDVGPGSPNLNSVAQIPDIHSGVQETLPGWTTNDAAGQQLEWTVRKVQLVGLTKNPTPVVYLTDGAPDMKRLNKQVRTRELDDFEKAALQKLNDGQDLYVESHGKEIRMMGPIFASGSCLSCHNQAGQLLGAFTYEIERIPVSKSANP
jgi:hypothetical protein